MNNLKRVLSVGMASTMVLGMMATASAASFNDFTDKDDIVNKDAVSMVTELGIIAGLPDGSYGATQNIDRASFARLVCVALNGGKEPNLGNLKTTFTDTKGHWAEKYIAYCVQQGIIAGKGNNTFAPSANVTGSEAAKMLLVALGYNTTYEKIGGATWQVSTDVLANQAGLYEDLSGMNTSAALTRDQAAQMIYNTLNADLVKYEMVPGISSNGQVTMTTQRVNVTKTVNGTTKNVTMLEDAFNAVKIEGVAVANDQASVTTEAVQGDGKTFIDVTDGSVNDGTFKVDSSLDVLGKSVTLYVQTSGKTDNNGNYSASNCKVLGSVIVNDNNTVVSTTAKKSSISDYAKDNDLKVDSAKYLRNFTTASFSSNVAGSTLTLIDNDDNGKVDYVLQTMKTFGKVSAYSDKSDGSITVKISDQDNTSFSGTFYSNNAAEDVDGFEDVKKDDYVFVYKIGNDMYVEKAESVEGTVTSVKGDKATVDGTEYEMSGLVTGVNDKDEKLSKALENSLKESVKLVLDAAGNVVLVTDVDSTSDYLVVTKADENNTFSNTQKAKVVFADGTKATITIDTDEGETVTKGDVTALYTYTKDKNDVYTLKKVNSSNNEITLTDGKIVKGRVNIASNLKADSATIFVIGNKDGDGYSVYTGIANVPDLTVEGGAKVVADKQSGTADFVFVAKSNISGGNQKSIYVMDSASVTVDANDDKVYTWDVVLDGKVITVTDDKNSLDQTGIWNVYLNGDEITSYTFGADAKTVDEAGDGVLTVTGDKTYSYNDDTVFMIVDKDEDGYVTDASVDRITTTKDTTNQKDWSKVVVVTDKDNENLATYVYICE